MGSKDILEAAATDCFLSEIVENMSLSVNIAICFSAEINVISGIMSYFDVNSVEQVQRCFQSVPGTADELSSVLASQSPALGGALLYKYLYI